MSDRTVVSMKGTPKHIGVTDNIVDIWIASPTGDASDSVITTLICVNNAQAQIIAKTWINAFNL